MFFLILAGLRERKEKARWGKERNRTKEVRWEEWKETRNKGRLIHFHHVLIYISRGISIWCSSRASLHFPEPQTGLFWWMTHQSTTPVTETAHLTKAHLSRRRKSTETLLQADAPHTRKTLSKKRKKTLFNLIFICISMYTTAIVCTRCV